MKKKQEQLRALRVGAIELQKTIRELREKLSHAESNLATVISEGVKLEEEIKNEK